MATSLSKLSSHLHWCLLSNRRAPSAATSLCTTAAPSSLDAAALEPEDSGLASEADVAPSQQLPQPASAAPEPGQQRTVFNRPLKDGLDAGIYKQSTSDGSAARSSTKRVGQNPVVKRLKIGRMGTMFSIGIGGIHNNRRPLQI